MSAARTIPEPDLADLTAQARTLVARMTLEEKAALTSGLDFWHTKGVERLGLDPVMVTDGPHGLRKQQGVSDHLGLNGSVPATCFPTGAALGSTWDPALLRRVGEALGTETRANEVAVILGPGANMKRSPLCGRNFEYLSEDPLVAGESATALIEGIQSRGVGTSLKHFAANNQETDRMRVSADVDERPLREIYLPAFERAVRRSQPWTVMCSYNRINDVYVSESRELLTSILRDEWGFDGLVVSDWGAVNHRIPGLIAGLDLEMPSSGGNTDTEIVQAVRSGDLDESILDTAAVRITTLLLRARPALADPIDPAHEAHHALAREVAAAGAVLLRNEVVAGTPALPLDPTDFSASTPLVVIGEFARTPRYQGAGSSQINPTRIDDALSGLREALGADAIAFQPGFHLDEASGLEGQDLDEDTLARRAIDAATGATVVLFVGLPAATESEGYDRTDMDLPADQVRLIHAVAGVAARTIVVLSNGSAVLVSDWEDEVDALLESWLGGQASGSALTDVLLGRVAPSGRLAESIPVRQDQVPAHLNFPGSDGHVRYGEGLFIGYRGFDAMGAEVSYPFGFGLTYTTFSIEGVEVAAPGTVTITDATDQDEIVCRVRARVTNTGTRAGAEVVQVYVGRAGVSQVSRVPRELRAFTKVWLEAGESVDVELALTRRDFSHWDIATHSWAVEAGTWEVSVGSSSRNLAAVLSIVVDAPDLRRPLDEHSTLAEWLDDPEGAAITRSVAGQALDDFLARDEGVEMFLAIPLDRLSRMPGELITPDQHTRMLADLASTVSTR